MDQGWRSNSDAQKLVAEIKTTKLEDGGHTLIHCSSCRQPLIEVWIIRPIKMLSTITVNCPFCGDKSFEQEVEGQFCLGHLKDTVITNSNQNECYSKDNCFIQKVEVIIEKEE